MTDRTPPPSPAQPRRDGETETMLPEREVRFEPRIHWSHRRPLGFGPAPILGAAAAVLLVLAIVLLALGAWVAGILVALLCAVLAGLFVVAIGREPETRSARLATGAADRADASARLTAVTVRVWFAGGLELARISLRRKRLRGELDRRLSPLGEAVYREDLPRATELKAELHGYEEALDDADRRADETIAALRGRIEQERIASGSTQRLSVVRAEGSEQLDAGR